MEVHVRWNRFLEPQLIVFSFFALLYIYVLAMLMSSKQKLIRGSYFVVFIYTGFVDVSLCFADQFFRASYRLGLGPSVDWIFNLCANMTGINFSLHVFGNFLMSLCQYTAVCWPHLYDRLWSFNRTLLYLFSITVITIAAYTEGFLSVNVYKQREDGSFKLVETSENSSGFIIGGVQTILYVFSSMFLVWRTLVAINSTGINNRQLKKHHRGLALITVVDCLLFGIDLINEIHNLFGPGIISEEFFDIFYSQFDIYYAVIYSCNPWLLFIFSRLARQEILRPFCRRKQKTTNNAPSHFAIGRNSINITQSITII